MNVLLDTNVIQGLMRQSDPWMYGAKMVSTIFARVTCRGGP